MILKNVNIYTNYNLDNIIKIAESKFSIFEHKKENKPIRYDGMMSLTKGVCIITRRYSFKFLNFMLDVDNLKKYYNENDCITNLQIEGLRVDNRNRKCNIYIENFKDNVSIVGCLKNNINIISNYEFSDMTRNPNESLFVLKSE